MAVLAFTRSRAVSEAVGITHGMDDLLWSHRPESVASALSAVRQMTRETSGAAATDMLKGLLDHGFSVHLEMRFDPPGVLNSWHDPTLAHSQPAPPCFVIVSLNGPDDPPGSHHPEFPPTLQEAADPARAKAIAEIVDSIDQRMASDPSRSDLRADLWRESEAPAFFGLCLHGWPGLAPEQAEARLLALVDAYADSHASDLAFGSSSSTRAGAATVKVDDGAVYVGGIRIARRAGDGTDGCRGQ